MQSNDNDSDQKRVFTLQKDAAHKNGLSGNRNELLFHVIESCSLDFLIKPLFSRES
jgi:hypothetical protein